MQDLIVELARICENIDKICVDDLPVLGYTLKR